MCGIAGIVVFRGGKPPDPGEIRSMCDRMVHRGPDEEGYHLAGCVAFGMRRLSIIDVAGGSQPVFNEDHTVAVVFNGEIYNFRELRRELEQHGHVFTTHTDTETIVHAYEAYGLEFPRHLNGMFAIALHDSAKGRVILARDHIGIKPLYYSFTPERLVFGSEIKVLLAGGRVARELDLDALAQYVSWEYVPGGDTLLRSVNKLEPASMVVFDLADPRCSPRAYWDVPPEQPSGRSPEEWVRAIDAKLHECVQRQLVSDVPLGAFLSGGVDSSLMVAGMGKAKTFSIGFDDPSYNELAWSRRVAAHLGVEHVTEVLEPDILELYGRLIHHLDDPIGDFSIFPTFLVSQLARRSVTVSLSGDGGDELFGGYETYIADRLAARFVDPLGKVFGRGLFGNAHRMVRPRPEKKGLVNMMKRFMEGTAYPPELSHARWRLFAGERRRAALFTPEAQKAFVTPVEAHVVDLFRRAGARDPLNRSLYVDLKSYLCDNILVKVDRMSMAVSLEARVPYLDREFVELAFQVPAALKVRGRKTKCILKEVAALHVPRECVYRPKEGFSIPIKNWLCTTLRPLMEENLDRNRLEDQGIFDADVIETMKAEHLRGVANHSHVLWALIVFQSWHGHWIEGKA